MYTRENVHNWFKRWTKSLVVLYFEQNYNQMYYISICPFIKPLCDQILFKQNYLVSFCLNYKTF